MKKNQLPKVLRLKQIQYLLYRNKMIIPILKSFFIKLIMISIKETMIIEDLSTFQWMITAIYLHLHF